MQLEAYVGAILPVLELGHRDRAKFIRAQHLKLHISGSTQARPAASAFRSVLTTVVDEQHHGACVAVDSFALGQGLTDILTAVLVGARHHLGECIHNDEVVGFPGFYVLYKVGDLRRFQ
ncbi:hypothetical protein D3C86_1733450 [compost metagenome]